MTDSAGSVVIRPGRPADGPAFVDLVRQMAVFESLPGPDDAACARLLADAFADAPRFSLTVAELAGEVCAYAVSYDTYSTFRARPSLFLEDVFVHPRARRLGIASALLEHLRARAQAGGYGRFEWNVLDWNTDAIAFYEGLGAEYLASWRVCRITLP